MLFNFFYLCFLVIFLFFMVLNIIFLIKGELFVFFNYFRCIENFYFGIVGGIIYVDVDYIVIR